MLLYQEDASHHGEDLEVVPDAGSEHDLLVFSGRDSDSYTEWDFLDNAIGEAWGVIHGEVPDQYTVPLEAVLPAMDDWMIEHTEHLGNF